MRFEVRTKVPNFTGVSAAGINFTDGCAVVTSDTKAGLAALSYFKTAGYMIKGLDEVNGRTVEVDEVLARGHEAPEAEAARLRADNTRLEERLALDELRERNRELREKAHKADKAAEPTPTEMTPGDASGESGEGTEKSKPDLSESDRLTQQSQSEGPMMVPPQDNAPVDEWRAWAHRSGRMSEADAKKASKTAIQNGPGADYDRERAAALQAGGAS